MKLRKVLPCLGPTALALAIVACAGAGPAAAAASHPATAASRAGTAPWRAGDAPVHVGFVSDGRSALADSVRDAFVREIAAAFVHDAVVDFPASDRVAGDWTTAGVAAAIDRLLAQPDVGIVVALGPMGSDQLARRRDLPKPTVAALVFDGALQGLPRQGGASGVRRLTYVDGGASAQRSIVRFHELIPFTHVAVLARAGLLEQLPQFRTHGEALAESLGATVTFVPVTTSTAQALAALPANADAVVLAAMEQLDAGGLDSLIATLDARRLPAFSLGGVDEVRRGALACFAPKDDLVRRARRVAGALQRIVGGDEASTLPVDLASVPRLAINMATARAIGFSPTWATLGEADLIDVAAEAAGPAWSLAAVAEEARKASLTLKSAEREVEAGNANVAIARGALLPQVQMQATGTMVREETAAASFGQQPEHETEQRLAGSLVLLSDSKWANLSIERHRQAGREADGRDAELEAVQGATKAYLDVLRAKALANVDRANLDNTRTHLEQARLREKTGASSRADVYRWEAELAGDRRDVLQADARVQVASLELNRQLDRPLEEPFRTQDATPLEPGTILGDARLFGYLSTPETFRVFRDFMVTQGIAQSPQLAAADAAVAAAKRTATAARRSLWLPTVSLDGSWSDVLSRHGAGSSTPAAFSSFPQATDATWSVRLSASLPVFDGFIRNAQLGQANVETERRALDRRNADQSVAARIRASLQQAQASWLGIEQARQAAHASRSNFALVSDAYDRGAASITTLLDAKQAAFSAGEAEANAVYDFLGNLMDVERAVGRFDFFAPTVDRDAFFHRLDDFYRSAGVSPRKP